MNEVPRPEFDPPPPPANPAPAFAAPTNETNKGTRKAVDRKLYFTIVGVTIAAVVYYAFKANVEDTMHLYQGIMIMILSVVPGLAWAKNPSQQFPTFEAFLATFANSYAIPLLSGQNQLSLYDTSVVSLAGWGVLLFQITATVTFFTMPGQAKRTPLWTKEVFSSDVGKYLGYAFVLNTIYVFISMYFDAIPKGLVGPLRAMFFGIGIVCTFLQSLRWGQGVLPHREKVYFLINLFLQIVMLTSTLFLVNGISMLILAFAGYVSGSRRLPLAAAVFTFVILGILHNGKFMMRAKYWDSVNQTQHTAEFTALPAFYLEWVEYGLQSHSNEEEDEQKGGSKLLERTSLFHMMCLVINVTPERQPYLDGETYKDIPGQFIPRFFWEGKPHAHISTGKLSVYYGLQAAEDTVKTTIGFGVLAEAYANFGFIGLAGLGALFGFCHAKLRRWTVNSPILSYPGLFTVLLMSWSFATEHTLSTWLSSFYQGCSAVLGSILVVRSVFR